MNACISRGCSNPTHGLRCTICLALSAADAPKPQPAKPQAPFPGRVVLTVPWTALASDNLRTPPFGKAAADKRAAYDAALARFREIAADGYRGQPTNGPVRLSVVWYVPDNLHRDVTLNFWKVCGDALKGIIVADDFWQIVTEVAGKVAGIDRDHPRAIVTVEAL